MASLVRYNPLNDSVSLQSAMNRLFDESFFWPRGNGNGRQGLVANLYESADTYTLQLPMPGVKPEDVEITVQEENVQVKWSYKPQIPEGVRVHWNGFQGGKYQQSFALPAPINAESVEASVADGLLTLQLPKAEHARARTIKVNAKQTVSEK